MTQQVASIELPNRNQGTEIGAGPIGAHEPKRQDSPGGQGTRRGRQAPCTHVALWQGSLLVCPQSASEVQPADPPTGQHSPLPQHMVPGMQLTMKKVQNPSTHAAPVQGSASPSRQSASWVQVICSTLVCAAEVLLRFSQEPAMTPAPIRRNARRRSVLVPQSRAMRSNACPPTLTLPAQPDCRCLQRLADPARSSSCSARRIGLTRSAATTLTSRSHAVHRQLCDHAARRLALSAGSRTLAAPPEIVTNCLAGALLTFRRRPGSPGRRAHRPQGRLRGRGVRLRWSLAVPITDVFREHVQT